MLQPLDQTLPTDLLRISPWPDPVIDLVGHELRSPYVERFWLPILGPTTTLLLRQLANRFEEAPDGFELPVLDTAASLGLGTRGGRNAPFPRALERAVTFKLARCPAIGAMEVRRRIPPLTRVQVNRLPVSLQDAHAQWQANELRTPGVEETRRKARRLALSLAELGDDDETIETQLHRWKVHPAMAHEALRWARTRQRGIPAPPPASTGAVFTPAGDAA